MQQEHKKRLTKNYVLLVNETPVTRVVDELVQRGILNEEMREMIHHQPTRKSKARTLLGILPRRGPQAFDAFCSSLLTVERTDLVNVLTDPQREDMEVCFPERSSFHLGEDVYLEVDKDVIVLKQGSTDVDFPLTRWKQLENYMDDVDEAIDLITNNRYAYVHEHLGGNIYVTVDNSEKMDRCVNFRHYGSLEQRSATPGVSLTFEQYDKLKDVARVIPDLIPEMKDVIPCYMSHQNVMDELYCAECNPNGPDEDMMIGL